MPVRHPLGALDGRLTGDCFGNSSILGGTPQKQIPIIKQGTDFLRWSVNGDTPMAWALTRQKLEGFYEKATSRSSDKAKSLP